MGRNQTTWTKETRPKGVRRRGKGKQRQLREVIYAALESANKKGAEEYLVRLARRKNPSLFIHLLGKTVEKEMKVQVDERAVVEVRDFTGLNLDQIRSLKGGESLLHRLLKKKESE